MAKLLEAFKQHLNLRPVITETFTRWQGGGELNRRYRDKQTPLKWLIKLSNGWGVHDSRSVRDLNQREELFSVIAMALGIPAIEYWRLPTDSLRFDPPLELLGPEFVRDQVVICRWRQKATEEKLCPACTEDRSFNEFELKTLVDIFAYCWWIGDDDRKKEDVLWVEGIPHLYDQALSGPPASDDKNFSYCRGTHFQRFENEKNNCQKGLYPEVQAYKMSPSGFPSLVAHVFRDHRIPCDGDAPVLDKIRTLDRDDILKTVDAAGLSSRIGEELFKRTLTIKQDFKAWQTFIRNRVCN